MSRWWIFDGRYRPENGIQPVSMIVEAPSKEAAYAIEQRIFYEHDIPEDAKDVWGLEVMSGDLEAILNEKH